MATHQTARPGVAPDPGTRPRLLFAAAGLAIATLALGALGPLPAGAADVGPAALQELAPGIRDSAALTTAVVATGTAVTSAGKPVPTGTPVVLQAWPPSSVLHALAEGESVKISPVGGAVTRADGSFDLRFSDPSLLAPYVDTNGLVDLEVVTRIDGQPSVQALSYPAPREVATAVGVPAETQAEFDIADARAAKAVALTRDGGILKPDADDAGDGASDIEVGYGPTGADTDVQDKTCVSTKIKNLGSRPTVVGRAFTVTGATATLTFTAGASSELGIGFSLSGSKGSFRANGTSSVESESVTEFSPSAGISGRIWKTDFHFAKFRIICTTGANAQTMYEVRATAHDGGAQASIPSGPPTVKSANCKKYGSGSNFTKSTTGATKFSGGVEISSIIGIDLSSKTGYTKKAAVKYHFSKTLRLCGTKGLPADNPGTLVAKEL